MKILVLGNGFIGKPLAEFLNADVSTARIDDIISHDLELYDVVINTVAKTSIDWCEKNRGETFAVNTIGAVYLAKITRGKYVFLSSACIFKSEDAYDINFEDSVPNPQCFYTYTKLMAEQLLEEARPDTLIIRPRLIISEKSHPRNTIDKLLKYDKVLVNQESATVLEDMLPKIKELIESDAKGAYNIFNEGTISPAEIMDIFGKEYEPITKDQLDEITKGKARRVSTVLGSNKTKHLPPIRDRIREIRKSWHIDL